MSKKEKYYSEEQNEVKSFIKILVGLIIIFAILYFLSVKFVDKEKNLKRTNNPGKIQYDSIIIGTLLNRADSKYYVLVFDSEDVSSTYIVNKASLYKSSTNALPLYTADLSLELNKTFKSDTSHYNKDSIDDISFKTTTLVMVKDGKITKFIENYDDIINELSIKEGK